jgi:YARHG domain
MKTAFIGLFLFSVAMLFGFTSCQQYSSKTTNAVEQPIRTEKVEKVLSVKRKIVHNLAEVVSLWTGRFEPVGAHLAAKEALNETIAELMAAEDNEYYEEYTYQAAFEQLSASHKKWFYRDPLFGSDVLRKGNAISVIITKVDFDSIWGRSVCAGNERPIVGSARASENGSIDITMFEPGDDPYDGTFELTFVVDSSHLIGTWTPYNKQLEMKPVLLKSAEFVYAPEGAEWDLDEQFIGKNISTDTLIELDIENETKQHLRLLRNLIYARHGYSFKKKDVRSFYEYYNWYVPLSTDIRNELTTAELKNISLMKRYEDYAEDYYDEFGR